MRYLLTAAALLAFWYGLTEFTRLILQVFLGADTATSSAAQWVQRFATSAAFLLVGAPAWWGHWWSQQMRVRSETYDSGGTGASERGSLVRRVYLMGVVLVGLVVVVAAVGFGAFLALNWRATDPGGVRAGVAGAAAAALVALFWTLVHGLMLRSDMRYLAGVRRVDATEWAAGPALQPAPVLAAAAVGVPGGMVGPAPAVAAAAATRVLPAATRPLPLPAESREYRREDLEPLAAAAGLQRGRSLSPAARACRARRRRRRPWRAIGAALRAAFPDALLWPLGLNEVAHTVMLGALGDEAAPPVPDDVFDQAGGILAPSDVLIPGALNGQVTAELVEALARTAARIMLLPPETNVCAGWPRRTGRWSGGWKTR